MSVAEKKNHEMIFNDYYWLEGWMSLVETGMQYVDP